MPFPLDKALAIVVKTNRCGDVENPIFSVSSGETNTFPIPAFAQHVNEAWMVANVEVQIGEVVQTGHTIVDRFNAGVMRAFNLASGNLLRNGNVLTWNIWGTAPSHVNRCEWAQHAEKWRKSIDADHGSPEGKGSVPRYFDGTEFEPIEDAIDAELEQLYEEIKAYLKNHLPLG